MSNFKAVFGANITMSRRKRVPKWRFLGKIAIKLKFRFCDPKRHILVQNRLFWRILRQNPGGRLGCRRYTNPLPQKRRNSRVNILMREVARAQKRNPLSDLDEILLYDVITRKFWWRSVKGFCIGGVQILPFAIDFDRRLYNTVALPCECVMNYALYLSDCLRGKKFRKSPVAIPNSLLEGFIIISLLLGSHENVQHIALISKSNLRKIRAYMAMN